MEVSPFLIISFLLIKCFDDDFQYIKNLGFQQYQLYIIFMIDS